MSFMLVLIINVYDGAILIFNSDLISALIATDCDAGISFSRSKPGLVEKIIGNCFVFRIYLSFHSNEDKGD